jgi:hypothetical protein
MTVCSIRPLFLSMKMYRYIRTHKGVFYLSKAPQPLRTLVTFSVSYSIHRRQDSLDGGSASRKAATCTEDTTNRELKHTDIHVSSGIRTNDLRVRAAKTVHASDGETTVMDKGIFRVYKISVSRQRPVSVPTVLLTVSRFSFALRNLLLDQFHNTCTDS